MLGAVCEGFVHVGLLSVHMTAAFSNVRAGAMETSGGLKRAHLLLCLFNCFARPVGQLLGCQLYNCSKQGLLIEKLGTLKPEPY
jgi:hypothetical protein